MPETRLDSLSLEGWRETPPRLSCCTAERRCSSEMRIKSDTTCSAGPNFLREVI